MVGKYMWWYMCIKCTQFFPEVCQWTPIKPRPYTNMVLTIPFRSSPAIDCCGSTTCCAKTRCDVMCCAVPAIIFQHILPHTSPPSPHTAKSHHTPDPHHTHTCTRTHTHIIRYEQRNHCKICEIWYGLARWQTYQELYPMQSRILFDKTKTPLSKMWPYILSFLH